jgi:hypothetical protein
MEISEVRKRLNDAIARARQHAAERRSRTQTANRSFDQFLAATAVPLIRQIANVLRAEGYFYSVSTPPGSVRLLSDKDAEDFIELFLDFAGEAPRVMARISRSRGRRVIDVEREVASGDLEAIGEEELLAFLLKELEPFVER